MKKYREMPWKKNIRKLPQNVEQSLKQIKTELVAVAASKIIPKKDLDAGIYAHLQIPDKLAQLTGTVPLEDVGTYSERNVNGWEVTRRDLPMITKTYYWETPNFGDASTYGTHIHFQDREVYQREFHEPRNYGITAELMQAGADGSLIVKFAVDHFLDTANPNFEAELLFMLNLLQENVGAASVFSSEAKREEFLGTIALDWEVFPPGTREEVMASLTKGRKVSDHDKGVISERVGLFSSLKPRAYLRGTSSFGSYVGALYADDLVVFENIKYGNAMYILYDNWEGISKRSRLELLRGTDASFDRIPHREGWKEGFGKIMRREKRKRGLPN